MEEELAEERLNPYYFTDRALHVGFKITLDSQHINSSKYKLKMKPNSIELGFETKYIKTNFKKLATIFDRLINQYKFKYQTVFPAKFDKQDEGGSISDEAEYYINLIIIKKITEFDIGIIDFKAPLKFQTQNQKKKDSAWRYDKINSLTFYIGL